ncbi:hypothetical protein [Rubrobacter radiotolerans]|nr:hypothetical protein [Rubrobacter radiotolerans]MDX5892651.1 hypothetical protein [Rubrobacter radiotolerans]
MRGSGRYFGHQRPKERSAEEWGIVRRVFGVGPVFPKSVLYALFFLFGLFVFLLANWFGLLLLNSEGVVDQLGILNALRVTAGLMGGVAVVSVFLMLHYHCLYYYESDGNVFFSLSFALSFMMGTPCGLVGLFG